MRNLHADRVILSVAPDQASHGAMLCLQSQDGTVYFRTPGGLAVDDLCAREAAKRWNMHPGLTDALVAAREYLGDNHTDDSEEAKATRAVIDDALAGVVRVQPASKKPGSGR